MLNKKQIASHVNALAVITGLGPEYFIITAGSAAVMHGIRETTADIDLDVHQDVWERLKRIYPGMPVVEGICGPVMEFGELFDIHPVPMHDGFGTVDIDGSHVLDLPSLRGQYVMLATHENRQPEKVRRDNDTILAIHKRLEVIHASRPIASAEEATPLLKDVVNSKFDFLRLCTWFREYEADIICFADEDHRVWYARRTYGPAQETTVRLCRTVGVPVEALHGSLVHPTHRSSLVARAEVDQQIEISIQM
ncbi:hypothetical protein [Pseudomonas phage D6]|nr:hypothetical protein [Pseudomonas phage D6]